MNDGSNHIILNVVCVLVLNENNMVKIPRRGYKLVKSLFGQYEEIPEEWQIFSLTHKDILKLSSGKSISNIQSMGDYPVYGSNGIIGYTTQYNNDDSILIGRVGASGSIHYLDHEAWVTDNVLIAKVSKKLEKEFCVYALSYLNLGRFATKSAQPLLTQAILKIVKIKIPTLQEQQKIASILSGVDALIESTQKIIEKTEMLKRGLMQKILTKGIGHTKFKKVKNFFNKDCDIPNSWAYPKFASLIKINPKTAIDAEFAAYVPMNAVNTNNSKVNYFERRKVSDISNLPKFLEYDVLFARITPSTENGKTALIENFQEIGVASSELTILRCNERVLPKYLYYYMKSYRIRSFAISQMLGTTNRQRVPEYVFEKDLNFELPLLSEQQKIASILSGVDAYIQKNQQYKERLEKLKKGLMQKLLTGQIRVKV